MHYLPIGCQWLEVDSADDCVKGESNNAIHERESIAQNVRLGKVWVRKHGRM